MPSKVFINGGTWTVRAMTKKEVKANTFKESVNHGVTNPKTKEILIRPGLNKDDAAQTLLHEGLHAICYQNSHIFPVGSLFSNEEAIHALTNSLMGFLKSTGLMPA